MISSLIPASTLFIMRLFILCSAVLSSNAIANGPTNVTDGSASLIIHSASDSNQSQIAAQIQSEQYEMAASIKSLSRKSMWQAANPQQSYQVLFGSSGPEIKLPMNNLSLKMELVSIGYADKLVDSSITQIVVDPQEANRLIYKRQNGIEEWYVNRPEGIEQGFTLNQRLPTGDGLLGLNLAIKGEWEIAVVNDQAHLRKEGALIRYSKLKAWDSTGLELASRMEQVDAEHLALYVEDAKASYPITIDPLIQNEDQKITPFDGAEIGAFGGSVALSAKTLVVGRPWYSGKSIYVYDLDSGNRGKFGLTKRITVEDFNEFNLVIGRNVAVSGDMVVTTGGTIDGGQLVGENLIYIFERNLGGENNFGLLKKITGVLGRSINGVMAADGDTVIVGLPELNNRQGAVFIYERNLGGVNNFGLRKELMAGDGQARDEFGISVAIEGNTIVVGAWENDAAGAAYVYERDMGGANNFGLRKKLLASDATATDRFGKSVDISANTVVVGAPFTSNFRSDSGAIYVFDRNAGGSDNFGEVKILHHSDEKAGDHLGFDAAISGNTVMSRTETYVSFPPSPPAPPGAAYVFERNHGGLNNFGEVKKLQGRDSDNHDVFGVGIALDADIAVVGAPLDNNNGIIDAGAVYIFIDPTDPKKSIADMCVPIKAQNGATAFFCL